MQTTERTTRLTELMSEHGWGLLLFYGHSWRKDHFRYLVNFNFSGPHAVAALDRSGDVRAMMSDPWDAELINATFEPDFARGLRGFANGRVAIAGMELMEARFVHAVPGAVSATSQVEELRRVKSPEEIAALRRAA